MFTPRTLTIFISGVLGLVLAMPSNICIVVLYLESLIKKEKMSHTDVIFLAKGIINILLQGFLTLQAMLFVFFPATLYNKDVYGFVNATSYFFTYFSFWLTAWLSIHYCTSITKLSCGVFVWLKRIVSRFLYQILLLTAAGLFIVNVSIIWGLIEDIKLTQKSRNGTQFSIMRVQRSFLYFCYSTFLGCVLPFCISLLCLVLTSSFLVRHIRRVKNNDSGSSQPNLEAHVTALRTIFFLLLLFLFFCVSQVFLAVKISFSATEPVVIAGWNLRLLSTFVEAAVIFQASNKLRRIVLERFRTRFNTET